MENTSKKKLVTLGSAAAFTVGGYFVAKWIQKPTWLGSVLGLAVGLMVAKNINDKAYAKYIDDLKAAVQNQSATDANNSTSDQKGVENENEL